ncbi:MAG TPA: tyrosine-type recombinase/integrase [Edaphobacter sp.]|jgi:site-specific recombinase XerD|nr:tyrosine-type recombinase/integrase [Edaphobacter sp.]
MRRWDRLLDIYMEEYRARGVSEGTIGHTESRLERWGSWLKKRRPRVAIEQIGVDLITNYIAVGGSFRSKSTVYSTLSTMRGFGDFLVRQGLWKINPLRWMKGPKVSPYNRLPKRIDRSHMEAMWIEATRRRGDYSAHLWVTILALLYGTGLRRGELARLDTDAYDRAEGTLRIDGRKTGHQRCLPLPETVLHCLEAYLPLRHNQLERIGMIDERALLVSRNGKRLTSFAISNGVHTISRSAQVPVHSLHQFRHTCASDLLEAGVHLAEVQRILGHCVISTTVRYVHIADPQRRAAIELHPINQWLPCLEVSA